MLIDFHVHLAGSGCCSSGIVLGNGFQKRPTFLFLKRSQKITQTQLNTDIDLIWIKRIADFVNSSAKVTKAVVLCLDAPHDADGHLLSNETQLCVPNDWGCFAAQKFASAFYWGASVHPYRKDALKELERCVQNKAYVMKWLPSMMGIEPDSPKCFSFYEALAHYNIPLLCHVDKEYTFAEPVKGWLAFNHLSRLETALKMGVTVIAAHAGTPSQMEIANQFCKKYERFYTDSSGLFSPTRARSALKLFAQVQNSPIRDRLLFGTDWPVPAFPFLLVDKIGFSAYRHSLKMLNPIERDLYLKEQLGFGLGLFKKNQESLLTLLGRSHTEESLT